MKDVRFAVLSIANLGSVDSSMTRLEIIEEISVVWKKLCWEKNQPLGVRMDTSLQKLSEKRRLLLQKRAIADGQAFRVGCVPARAKKRGSFAKPAIAKIFIGTAVSVGCVMRAGPFPKAVCLLQTPAILTQARTDFTRY